MQIIRQFIRKILNEANINQFVIDRVLTMYNIDPDDKLGDGSYGIAYNYGPNLVLKITTDQSEAVLANKIKGNKFKHISEIQSVVKMKGENIFIIILEKLEPLPDYLFDAVYYLRELEEYFLANRKKSETFQDWIVKNKDNDFFSHDQKDYLQKEPIEKVIWLYNQIKSIDEELNFTPHLYKIGFRDVHPGNMGVKKGNLAVFDIQADEFKPWRLKQIRSVAN